MSDATEHDAIIRIDRPRCTIWVAADRWPRLEAFVAGLEQEPIEAAPVLAGFRAVKQSTVRTVMAGEVPGEPPLAVHLKLYRPGRIFDRVRDALQGARAPRELERLRAARALGLPCVAPLAAGLLRGSGGARSFLLTETGAGAVLPRGRLDATIAPAAGRLLDRVHAAGLDARDLHPGNVLRTPDDRLLLLDLAAARAGDPLDRRARARGLAFFCLDLDCGVMDRAARPLLDAYGAEPELREAAAAEDRRLRRAALRAFGRRATRACAHTTVERRGAATRFLHRPAAALHEPAHAWLDQFAGDAPPVPDKRGRRGSVHRTDALVAKQRPAAAARQAFEAAYWLLFARVPAPQPVALQLAPGGGIAVFARIPGPTAAEALPGIERARLLRLARGLGTAVGRLHAHGLRNRDLKLENLIVDGDRVVPVDLDGVRLKRPTDRRGEAADLGRLEAAFAAAGAPHGDAARRAFLRGYTRALACLQHRSPNRFLLQSSAARAAAWRQRHPAAAAGSGARDTRSSPPSRGS